MNVESYPNNEQEKSAGQPVSPEKEIENPAATAQVSKEERRPDRAELRTFGRAQDTEGRQTLAKDIRESRAAHFERRRTAEEELADVNEAMTNRHLALEELDKQLEAVSAEIEQRTSTKIAEIFSFFKLKELREQLGITQQKREGVAAELQRNQALLDDIEKILQDKSVLAETRRKIKEYYGGAEAAYQQFERDEQRRDIGNLMRQHQAFFFHGIITNPEIMPRANTIVETTAPFEDRLKILLGLEPTISASTIKTGTATGEKTLWQKWGVILKGGYVEAGGSRDIASVSQGLYRRTLWDTKHSKIEAVEEAIESDPRQRAYNELVIRDPKVAGFYFWSDKKEPVRFSSVRTLEEAQAAGLPLFMVIKGEVYPAFLTKDESGGTLMFGPNPVSPEQLLDRNRFGLDDSAKKQYAEEVLTDSTFNIAVFSKKPLNSVICAAGKPAAESLIDLISYPKEIWLMSWKSAPASI